MKMAIIKKNQLVILVISLMLITAGYLNYMYSDSVIVATKDDEKNFGDATLVSSNNIIIEEVKEEEENLVTLQSSINNNEDEYFVATRLERSKMYSSQLEAYQQIIKSNQASNEQKNEASNKITYINEIQNKIMIAENLIKSKNFEDVVILVNGNSINIVVKKEKLENSEVAQIQNIVTRELNVEIENLHISNKI